MHDKMVKQLVIIDWKKLRAVIVGLLLGLVILFFVYLRFTK